jgi:hypothetical protein
VSRILTGFSTNCEIFYTHSPPEPILVLGSINILYNTSEVGRRGCILRTLSHYLCSAELIEKGILGELGARILLVIVRDFATLFEKPLLNVLKPVRLLDVLHKLFGGDILTGSDQLKFNRAFGDAYVNSIHRIITRDSLPEEPDS